MAGLALLGAHVEALLVADHGGVLTGGNPAVLVHCGAVAVRGEAVAVGGVVVGVRVTVTGGGAGHTGGASGGVAVTIGARGAAAVVVHLVVAVQLLLLGGGQVLVRVNLRSVLDDVLGVGKNHAVAVLTGALHGNEVLLGTEQTGVHGQEGGLAGVVVQEHLLDLADLVAVGAVGRAGQNCIHVERGHRINSSVSLCCRRTGCAPEAAAPAVGVRSGFVTHITAISTLRYQFLSRKNRRADAPPRRRPVVAGPGGRRLRGRRGGVGHNGQDQLL